MNWIRVDEQLPEPGERPLTYSRRGLLRMLHWDGGRWRAPNGGFVTPDPVHWWAHVPRPGEEESCRSIAQWGVETFGVARDPAVYVGRALEEMVELVELCAIDESKTRFECFDWFPECLRSIAQAIREAGTLPPEHLDMAREEAADVRIVLTQLSGSEYDAAVDTKMKVNRGREWRTDGKGAGQHD